MSNRILEKYTGRRTEDDDCADLSIDTESPDDLGAFGWLRGVRDRCVMLELRKKDGNILAIGYGWLDRAEFDPSEGITLHVMGRTIKIKGRNLNSEARSQVRLFEGIIRHRVPWIQEADEHTLVQADRDATVVDEIGW